MEETPENKFKTEFKYYKRKQPPPTFEQVLDVHNPEHSIHFTQKQHKKLNINPEVTDINNPSDWKIFSSTTNPGFHVITNALTPEHQTTWARRSLEKYSSKEFKRNIDLPGSRLDDIDDWYSDVVRRSQYIDKLRWSTLGYHHDWDTKVYTDEKSVFPPELFNLCALVADAIGYPNFQAQAAIVNFYPMSGTLSSHTDHSEPNTHHPIISISLGQSAIFLLGGSSLAVKPTSFLLKSGDIAVMEKEARLAYHAVPRILKSDNMSELASNKSVCEHSMKSEKTLLDVKRTSEKVASRDELNEPEFVLTTEEKELFCAKYLECHRININARQVH